MSIAQAGRAPVPGPAVLTAGLREVLADPELAVVARERNVYASTFASEVITCRTGDGGALRLLCKYHDGRQVRGHGHRGGVPYEARVYRQVVAPFAPSAVRCYGSYYEGDRDTTWLVLAFLETSTRVRQSTEPDIMAKVARWIGRFHAAHDARSDEADLRGLIRYDARYYEGWVRRTLDYVAEGHGDYPWLAPLCERFLASLETLTAAAPTVVHGEYYSQNVLVQDGVIYPIDWESAAVAVGEIDLATLTDHWPGSVARRCEAAYREARWPEGPPPEHGARLAMARVYIQLRWLGDRDEHLRVGADGLHWRFAELEALGRVLPYP